ncbi:MAG: hypothetical protein WC449_05585, partial [Candidatus Paceibacterota bacterium]
YYAQTVLKIQALKRPGETESRIVPFHFNEAQILFHSVWQEEVASTGMVRIVVLKARQEGISTYVEGRMFHTCHFNEDTNGLVVAHDADSTEFIFGMTRRFKDFLPKELRPMTRYSTQRKLDFDNPSDNNRTDCPGLRSSIEVHTAGKKAGIRSQNFAFAHLSECAFWPNPENVYALLPSIADAPGTVIVKESTANGFDAFRQDYYDAKNGISLFRAVFIPWFLLGDYSLSDIPVDEERELNDTLGQLEYFGGKEEQELVDHFGVSLNQLAWRRRKIRNMRGDIVKFHQEFPATDEEAFISSGSPIFSSAKLTYQQKNFVREPIAKGVLDAHGKLRPQTDAPLWIWKHPEPDYFYTVGVDVGSGSSDGDYSVASVWRIPRNKNEAYEQVAEMVMHIDPIALALPISYLARLYNNALLCIEANSYGLSTIIQAQTLYDNFYRWTYIDKIGGQITKKIGFYTNRSTAPTLANLASFMIDINAVHVSSKRLLSQMQEFTRTNTGKGESAGTGGDDCVYAFMIALFCGEREYLGDNRIQLADNPSGGDDIKAQELPLLPGQSPVHTSDEEFTAMLIHPEAFESESEYSDSWLAY